ncbi:CSLREA domain-containing protein [Hahella ganghwensis]|uniref:CSLREA domain-containing protein n=1 Tax=Hahella ganghwensis TaxID=286420 RepID=UPI000373B2BE|nr:CSLREA domain-containing protein [Hahella ganghwensis]
MKYQVTISALLVSALSNLVGAQTIYVTKFADTFDGTCDDDCSLREAIELANQSPGMDRIYLGAGTYTLEIPPEPDDWEFIDENHNVRDDFDITDDIEIIGRSMEDTIVKNTTRGRLFHVVSGNAWFERLSIVDGDTPVSVRLSQVDRTAPVVRQ